eukprot:m.161617 g.161617  ORF g.161617 m.161617 type:complete len:81 (-) comp31245_c6_seq1:55-297(-)
MVHNKYFLDTDSTVYIVRLAVSSYITDTWRRTGVLVFHKMNANRCTMSWVVQDQRLSLLRARTHTHKLTHTHTSTRVQCR